MDESFQEIETELKTLPLRRPTGHLLARIEHDLAATEREPAVSVPTRDKTATNLNSWKWLGWRGAGLAAALGLSVAFGILKQKPAIPVGTTPIVAPKAPRGEGPAQSASRSTERYQPVAATNVFYDLKDEGPVHLDGELPARRLRYRYLDTYTWKDPRGSVSLKWSVPRDEIRVLPASMN